jgi:hypothetical protein
VRSGLSRLTIVSAGVFWIASLTPFAARADSSEAGGASRVAVALFLSYQVPGAPTFDVGALHAGCWDLMAAAVHDFGRGEVGRTEIEPFVHRWGVRTASLVSDGFLKEIAAGCNASELLVCDLLIYPDRLALCARSVRTDTGRVVWADVEDVRLSPETGASHGPVPQRWLDAAGPAGRRLLGRWNARPAREDLPSDLFLLPIRTEGLETAVGRLVTCCLLRSLLESPGGGIEDPGVTFSRLSDAGVDPQRLDRRMRPILGGNGAHCAVLVSDLVADGYPDETPQALRLDEEAAISPTTQFPASVFSVRLVDADSGTVIFSATEYIGVPSTRGLFGVTRDVSLIKRVQRVTDRLVHAAMQKG